MKLKIYFQKIILFILDDIRLNSEDSVVEKRLKNNEDLPLNTIFVLEKIR